MKYEETAKRLRTAMDRAGIKAVELAERSGVNKSSISQYVNGSHAPSNISAGAMANVLSVSPVWLMGFDVPMVNDSIELTEAEVILIRKYRELDPYDQGWIAGNIEKMLAEKRGHGMEFDKEVEEIEKAVKKDVG